MHKKAKHGTSKKIEQNVENNIPKESLETDKIHISDSVTKTKPDVLLDQKQETQEKQILDETKSDKKENKKKKEQAL